MAFLLVVIVIIFAAIFLVVCGLVLPLMDVIDQFRHRRTTPEPPPPRPRPQFTPQADQGSRASPHERSRNGITFLMAVPGRGVRRDE